MAINNYLQTCDYKLGGLQPYIYLIHKDALKLNIKAKGVEVFFDKTKEGDVYKLHGQLVIYQQQETYSAKYRFNSTLSITINEQYREPFYYGLRTLRTNQYYIIIEDKKGVQYLVNPELFTKMTYEYTFTDTVDNHNSVEISYSNLSNFPLLIFKEKIESNLSFLTEECNYTIGNIYRLFMTSFKDLTVKDDGVKANEMYITDVSKLKEVEYLKESFTLIEKYDGHRFESDLSFSIPMSENQFEWAYDLLEFKDNTYKALLRTTNDNYLLIGQENGMMAEYTITTSESDEELNKINVRFTTLSQYPILYTDEVKQYRWIKDGELCFGFDKYQMLTQQYSTDWGETWVNTDPIIKKKGELIESDSESCKLYQWVEDGLYCETIDTEYVKWLALDGEFLCENGDKCQKLQKYTSTNNVNYTPQEEYGIGNVISTNAEECSYIVVKWRESIGHIYEEVNEGLNKYEYVDELCQGLDLVEGYAEFVTSDGIDYYPSGENEYRTKKENCCACGFIQNYEYKEVGYVCGSKLGNYLNIINTSGNWNVNGFTFTSDKISDSQSTEMIITFRINSDNEIKLQYDISSESGWDKFYYSSIDGTSANIGGYSGIKSGTITLACSSGEHTIRLKYTKDGSQSSGRDNVIVTLSLVNESSYNQYDLYTKKQLYVSCEDEYATVGKFVDEYEYELFESNSCNCGYVTYEYRFNNEYVSGSERGEQYIPYFVWEVWREYNLCDETLTGNVEYRNPTPSLDGENEDYIVATYEGDGSDSVRLYNSLSYNQLSVDGIRVDKVSSYVFNDTNEHIVVFEGVTSIGINAFEALGKITRLTSVTIGNGVTSIRNSAFAYCTNLTSVTIPNSVTSIEYNVFNSCRSLTSVTIPNSVTSIERYAFQSCESLTSITIPNSVTSIEDYAFYDCTSLKDLYIEDGETTLSLENSDGYLFRSCPLESLHLGRNIEYETGSNPFDEIKTLKSVTIGNSVTIIRNSAFQSCTSLTSVIIGNSVTSIENWAFADCTSLTSVTIPNSVEFIGYNAFEYCESLTTITIPNSVISIGIRVFLGCYSLTSVTIGNSVTSIGSDAFRGCSSLTSVTIGNSVTSIGSNAFYNCSSLTSVIIPNSVISIGYSAFQSCTSLTSVTIGNSVTTIDDYAFQSCTSLTSVTIPNSVISIGSRAFNSCSSLTSVTIGNSVTSFDQYVFRNCSGLKTITSYATTAPSIEDNTFESIAKNGTLYYPQGSDYSKWLSKTWYYLGYYNWNGVEI